MLCVVYRLLLLLSMNNNSLVFVRFAWPNDCNTNTTHDMRVPFTITIVQHAGILLCIGSLVCCCFCWIFWIQLAQCAHNTHHNTWCLNIQSIKKNAPVRGNEKRKKHAHTQNEIRIWQHCATQYQAQGLMFVLLIEEKHNIANWTR